MNYAVILAGGKGKRLGGEIPKQLLPLGNKTVLHWSVDTFIETGIFGGIIIVAEKSILEDIKKLFPPEEYPQVAGFVQGGSERSGSSYNALVSKNFRDDDIIAFHDAARPFADTKIIIETVRAASVCGAAGTYIPAVDTVTEIAGGAVISIPDRKNLFYTQTPQAFTYSVIREAHEKYLADGGAVTDDVSLVLNMGGQVASVDGAPLNFKITTESDYKIACFIASGGMHV